MGCSVSKQDAKRKMTKYERIDPQAVEATKNRRDVKTEKDYSKGGNNVQNYT